MLSQENDSRRGRSFSVFIPFLLALFLAIGIGVGYLIKGDSPEKVSVFTRTQYDKVEEILNYIDNRYVDTVDTKKLFNKAISEIFRNLDPHSMYISPEELARLSEPLRGEFEGIGVEFFIVEDTITVVATLDGGPSDKLGIKAGDKIVEINDTSVAGIGIENNGVISRLKGPADTEVNVTIKRSGADSLLTFNITRGAVNISSIDASYMLDNKTGYIKMSRFAANTHEEFVDAVKDLKEQGMEKLVLDIRDNGGGYLGQATKIADEFLSGDKLIVYTEGRAHDRRNYRAGNRGVFEEGGLVLLINENSASASEILAGAIQDWNRGKVIGRRTFGKALVQEEFMLENGGAMRLTVAEYYTPKGRSIQRSYANGVKEYREAHYDRMISEYEDSREFGINDTASFGIQPDIYVGYDTSTSHALTNTLMNNGSIPRFAYNYFSDHTQQFNRYESAGAFISDFTLTNELFQNFVKYNKLDTINASGGDTLLTKQNMQMAKPEIESAIKAYFAKQLFYYNGFFRIFNQNDEGIRKAVELLNS